jgi:CspA family cold shock protein
MPFRDELLTCETCSKKFVYRVEEQRLQQGMGFEAETPTKCPNCREPVDAAPGLRAGVVKWYRDDKHFGFITQSAGSDVFFHRSGVDGDISGYTEDTPVWYEVETTDRGLQAINIHLRE